MIITGNFKVVKVNKRSIRVESDVYTGLLKKNKYAFNVNDSVYLSIDTIKKIIITIECVDNDLCTHIFYDFICLDRYIECEYEKSYITTLRMLKYYFSSKEIELYFKKFSYGDMFYVQGKCIGCSFYIEYVQQIDNTVKRGES